MAGKIPDLVATVRTGTGKGAARQARRSGDVPGVVYGGGKDPAAISMEYNSLMTRLKKGRFLATLFNLKVAGQDDVRVICRAVQRDVVKDTPMHVDFMRLRATTRVDIYIHVTFINHEASPGLKKGGVLTVIRPEIELNVRANDIPEEIVVDLTGLDIGDAVSISDVTLPEGATPTIDRDFAICNVSAPSALLSEEAEAAEGEDDAEGEEDDKEEKDDEKEK